MHLYIVIVHSHEPKINNNQYLQASFLRQIIQVFFLCDFKEAVFIPLPSQNQRKKKKPITTNQPLIYFLLYNSILEGSLFFSLIRTHLS